MLPYEAKNPTITPESDGLPTSPCLLGKFLTLVVINCLVGQAGVGNPSSTDVFVGIFAYLCGNTAHLSQHALPIGTQEYSRAAVTQSCPRTERAIGPGTAPLLQPVT